MSAVGLESIDHTVQLTHIWINDLDARVGWENNTVRPVRFEPLQAVRDWVMVEEAAGLGDNSPSSCVALITSTGRPATTPVKKRSKADFIARIDNAFKADPIVSTPMQLRPCSRFSPTRSRPAKLSRYVTPCRRTSEHFGLFHRKPPEELALKPADRAFAMPRRLFALSWQPFGRRRATRDGMLVSLAHVEQAGEAPPGR